MKRCAIFVFFLLLFPPFYLWAKGFIEGEVLVKYRESAKQKNIRTILEKHSLERIEDFSSLRVQRVRLPAEKEVSKVIEELKKEADIEYAEPNYVRRPLSVPNDEEFKLQWNLLKIGMEQAWDIERGSREIIVAVLDTGVDYTHPDLSKNIWINPGEIPGNNIDDDGNGKTDDVYGWDFCSEVKMGKCKGEDSDPMDKVGHGTAVAGIIGAVTNNLKGIAGINHRISIMPVKFMQDSGDIASEVRAIEYAIKMGAKIINASYGGENFSRVEFEAIKTAARKGVLFVCAAGNHGSDKETVYPASYTLPNIISVASVGRGDRLSVFSNYGPRVHIAAPGEEIYSLSPQAASSFETAYIEVKGKRYRAYGMEFSGHTKGLEGEVIFCGKAKKGEVPETVNGKIALIERGDITFREKVLNVMEKGAIAAIIYNNLDYPLLFEGTLLEEGEYVPVVSISKSDGEEIASIGGSVRLYNYPYYGPLQGTSFAAPHVSGAAALLLSQRPKMDAVAIREAILSYSDVVPDISDKIDGGRRLNVLNVLKNVKENIPYTFTLILEKGWNFVSIPLNPKNPAIDWIFTGIRPVLILSYDNKKKEWVEYRGKPSDTLLTLESGRGYWIYMNRDANVVITGEKAENRVQLYEGWNLVGYNGDEDADTNTVLSSIGDKWVSLWTWEKGWWYVKQRETTSSSLEIETFSRGKAYWILVEGTEEVIEWFQ